MGCVPTWVVRARHDRRRAASAAADAVDTAAENGAVVHLAIVAHDVARLGLEAAAIDALDRLPTPRTRIGRARRDFARSATTEMRPASKRSPWNDRLSAHPCSRPKPGRRPPPCGRAFTSPLARRHTVGRLSQRQEEVARLTADGARSNEIAARLIIAERSVESHLQRIYLRLGIRSRTDMRNALDPHVP
jgi:DNA-binding CsgD family transcriptional regulator